jgi:hypothetical protein
MEDPNDTSGDAEAEGEVEADATNSMAYAAAEAAAAAAEAEEDEDEEEEDDLSQPCRLCGKGNDGRAMIRFYPVQVDLNVASVAPTTNTFSQDITLHVFCGKTASILPNVQMPQYEILSKAGIKNKHGIGAEVNGALARTRCANVATPGAKEKTFFIVHEFEAHLLAIRTAHQHQQHPYAHSPEIALQVPSPHHHAHHMSYAQQPEAQYQYQMPTHEQAQHHHHIKPSPVRAAAGAVHKHGRRPQESYMYVAPPPPPLQYDTTAGASEGKIRCACGGTHLPTGSAKGAASWRSHVMTKRHQKWMEDNDLLGAV